MPVELPPDTYGLWTDVQNVSSMGWPDTDEDVVRGLSGAWRRSAGPFTTAQGVDMTGMRDAWGDAVGGAYDQNLQRDRDLAGAMATTLAGVGDVTDGFATMVTDVKNGIRTIMADGVQRYAETDDKGYPEDVRALLRSWLVEQLAFNMDQIISGAVGQITGRKTLDDFGGAWGFIGNGVATTIDNARGDLQSKWFLTVGDGLVGGAEGLTNRVSDVKAAHAGFLRGEADRLRELARTGTDRSLDDIARLYREAGENSRNAAVLAREAGSLGTVAAVGSKVLGGGLGLAGVGIDIAGGKPEAQAWASGIAGFGASWVGGGAAASLATAGFVSYVAAGGVIGSAIPIPVVGTVAGILGGVVFGLAASGAVDWLFTDGAEVIGNTVSDGLDVLEGWEHDIGEGATDLFNWIFEE